MNKILNLFKSEILKMSEINTLGIAGLLLCFLQPFLAYSESQQILKMGNNLTMATNPKLAADIPPFQYIGFETLFFGFMVIVVISAYFGANEFKNNRIRTSLLSEPKKLTYFTVRFLAFSIIISIISIISVFLTVYFAQKGLGVKGLNVLNESIIFKNIVYSTLSYLFLGQFTYLISYLTRNNILSLIIMVPQVFNLGALLASKFTFGKYLPFNIITSLIQNPVSKKLFEINTGINLSLIMIFIVGLISAIAFNSSDMGRVK